MKKMILGGAFLALTVFAVSGFAQDETMKSNDKMKSGDKMMNSKMNADSKFMMMAATGGMNEISLSNQALSKSDNEDVKQYAQMMIDDHTKANDELKSVATGKNVTLPTEPDAKHKAMTEKMSAMSGSGFDMAYVKAMVQDHEKTVAMFQKEADNGKDADAKAFAVKTLPTLKAHLEAARSLMSKMNGGKMDNGKTNDSMKSGM